ncbi:hypothetical protein B0H17DRAFT_1037922 [Mycena rosella]|uniref:F-box domain-containing protein n=1 Tax=Mycena rosella TaxID=1033263 RepID=A0AAD7GUA7_MYCRO|nr:hypothetical protein B0H17DRAFT_1037922 [Mycena rosella]
MRRFQAVAILPPDIIDTTIDFVSLAPPVNSRKLERHSLLACSLVCRAWLPRTRHHLFRKRRVNRAFMALLATDGRTFAPHVRVLRLPWRAGSAGSKLYDHEAALLRRLTGMHALDFYLRSIPTLDLALSGARFHTAFLAHLSHITHLEICGAFSGDDNFVVDTLCMFPLLTHLVASVSHTPAPMRRNPPQPFVAPRNPFLVPKNLHSLELSNYRMSVLARFRDSGSLRNIHGL